MASGDGHEQDPHALAHEGMAAEPLALADKAPAEEPTAAGPPPTPAADNAAAEEPTAAEHAPPPAADAQGAPAMKRPAAATKGEALLKSAAEAPTPKHKAGASTKRKKGVEDAHQGFRMPPPRRHQRSQIHSTFLVP